jgi:Glu-tRNA(Gln) amidotransferase subunit E-like FAD-binding protein
MEIDYEEIGFKSGLEIHQQLDSGKLFSRTPSLLRSDEPDFVVKRKLHVVAGESGEVDIAAEHEAGLDKDFYYQGYNDSISLIELDEAPPEMINEDALKSVLHIALLLNCEILPVSQIMRKTVIDGSNTSGFQRTVLVARNGWIETSAGRVGIDTVILEEDSARPVERSETKVVYRLDRLGIPLVEIATAPDLKNAEQVKEAALQLGDILRSCKVRRGIGTIRQDVNISVTGHPRVEIKGFQDMKTFVSMVDGEVKRQLDEEKGESHVRNPLPGGKTEFSRPMPGSARMYPETDLPLLKISRGMVNEAKASLPKLRGVIKSELKKGGLSDEMVGLLMKGNLLEEFKVLRELSENADLIVKMIALWPKDFAKKLSKDVNVIADILNLDVLEVVLKDLKKGVIQEHDVQSILFEIASGKDVRDALKVEKISLDEIEEFVRGLIKGKPGLSIGAYMGLIVKEFSGKVSGKEVMEILKKYVK